MNPSAFPTLEHFLAAPLEEVRPAAPATVIYAAAGTRRDAALAGIPVRTADYPRWTQQRLFHDVGLFFQYGVSHLCMPMLGPGQFAETTEGYRENLWDWVNQWLFGAEARAYFRSQGWRVRIAFSQFIPQLRAAGEWALTETPAESPHTLWCFIIPEYNLPMEWMFLVIRDSQAGTMDEAVTALYGERLPPATLYLGTGKPTFSSLQLPPLLVRGPLQGYWNQRPGYSLDDESLRRILYDYSYLRQTWEKDKSGRAEQAVAHREVWNQATILGIGRRLGPFWYPAAIPALPDEIADLES